MNLTGDLREFPALLNGPADLEPATYVVRNTIELGNTAGMRISGAGGMGVWESKNGTTRDVFGTNATYLVWDGPDGSPMFRTSGRSALIERMTCIDMRGKSTGVQVYHERGLGTGKHTFRTMAFSDFENGIIHGEELNDKNCDLPYFDDVTMHRCANGLVFKNHQSVGAFGNRVRFTMCGTAFDYQAGGSALFHSVLAAHCDTFLKLDKQGVNNCDFEFRGVQIDGRMNEGWKLVHDENPERKRQITFSGKISESQRYEIQSDYVNDPQVLRSIDGSKLMGFDE